MLRTHARGRNPFFEILSKDEEETKNEWSLIRVSMTAGADACDTAFARPGERHEDRHFLRSVVSQIGSPGHRTKMVQPNTIVESDHDYGQEAKVHECACG